MHESCSLDPAKVMHSRSVFLSEFILDTFLKIDFSDLDFLSKSRAIVFLFFSSFFNGGLLNRSYL